MRWRNEPKNRSIKDRERWQDVRSQLQILKSQRSTQISLNMKFSVSSCDMKSSLLRSLCQLIMPTYHLLDRINDSSRLTRLNVCTRRQRRHRSRTKSTSESRWNIQLCVANVKRNQRRGDGCRRWNSNGLLQLHQPWWNSSKHSIHSWRKCRQIFREFPFSILNLSLSQGFRASGDAIPVPPAIPEYIERALAYIRDHPPQQY